MIEFWLQTNLIGGKNEEYNDNNIIFDDEFAFCK